MKARFLSLVVAMFIIASISTHAQNNLNFTLVNNTGVDMHKLYVAPISDSKSWGSDLLGGVPLKNGEYMEVTFNSGDFKDCKWDLKVKDKEGTSLTWYDIDLCKYWKVSIKFNFDTQKGTATYE